MVPSLCQLNSTSTVDFGNINDIGTTKRDYTAQGAVNTTCNYGTPYSIYLGDGNHRIAGGFRRMIHDNNDYIPYQLYKDSNYSTVWDATGGVTNVGGSGGVSKLVQVAPKVHPFMEKFRKALPFQLNRETILIVLL